MSEEKKISEEEKMFEEKKVADPFIAGFYESMAKTNTNKITKEIMADLSEILMIVMTLMWKVDMKILRTGRGDQAIPSSENRLLSKAMLIL
jgi:hypothetical protein